MTRAGLDTEASVRARPSRRPPTSARSSARQDIELAPLIETIGLNTRLSARASK